MMLEVLNNGGREKHDYLMLTYYHDFNLLYQQFNIYNTRTMTIFVTTHLLLFNFTTHVN